MIPTLSPINADAELGRLRQGIRDLEAENVGLHRSGKAASNSLALAEISFESITDGYYALDRDWRFIAVSRAVEQLTGKSRDDLIGRRMWDVFPDALMEDAYGEAPGPGEVRTLAGEGFSKVLGTWVDATVHRSETRTEIYFRDISARRIAEQRLRESEERLRFALESGSIGTWDFDPVTGALAWDERCKKLLGVAADGDVDYGVFLSRLHPEDRAATDRAVQAALDPAGPGEFEFEYRVLSSDVENVRWIAARGRSLIEEGRTVRFIGTVRDITDRKTAEDSLRRSEQQLRVALDAGRLGAWERDLRTGVLEASARCKANLGLAPDAPLTFEMLQDSRHPDDRERVTEAIKTAIAEGVDYDVEYRAIWPDNSTHWLLARGHAVYDESGKPTRMVGVTLDVTRRKQQEAELAEQKRILDLLNTVGATLAAELDLDRLVQTVTDAATTLTGAQFGAFFYNVVNATGEAYTLYTISGVPREAFSSFPMPRNTGVFHPTFRGDSIVRSDDITKDPRYGKNAPHYGMPAGHLPVRSYLAVPVISRSGEVLGGLFFGHSEPGVFTQRAEQIVTGIAGQAAIAVDNARLFKAARDEIAERKRVEEHQRLLLAELNHRVKNTLAVVLAIAAQTIKRSNSMEQFSRAFQGRLQALAQAHTLLTAGNWESASLRSLVEAALAPYGAREGGRVRIDGPPLEVNPRAALSLSMVFHELSTNASKYGAFSVSAGDVDVSWRVGENSRVWLLWRETGGPSPQPSPRRGFGTTLIDLSIRQEIGGTVSVDYQAEGLVCAIELPQTALVNPRPEPTAIPASQNEAAPAN